MCVSDTLNLQSLKPEAFPVVLPLQSAPARLIVRKNYSGIAPVI